MCHDNAVPSHSWRVDRGAVEEIGDIFPKSGVLPDQVQPIRSSTASVVC